MRNVRNIYFLMRAAFFGTSREAAMLLALWFMIGAVGAVFGITLVDAIKYFLTIGGGAQ